MPQKIQITQVEPTPNRYSLRVSFSDGTFQIVNFHNFLEKSSHPEIRKYLKLNYFKKFKLINGDLMWGDFDLVFPICDLYKNQINKKITPLKKASKQAA